MLSFRHFLESLEVHHGTASPLVKWDKSKHLSGYYPGFYTTSDRGRATTHGANIYSFDVAHMRFFPLDTPKAADELKKEARRAGYFVNTGSGSGEVKYLTDQGYDGIKRGNEYIIFNPESLPIAH